MEIVLEIMKWLVRITFFVGIGFSFGYIIGKNTKVGEEAFYESNNT